MKTVYQVYVRLEITSDDSADDVHEKVENLLEHGGVRDCFDAAELDASYFFVEKVKVKP